MIQTEPEDIEQIRERLRKMSDIELRKFGRSASVMADPKKNFGLPNPSFQIQLDEARAEWRRRHPKKSPSPIVFGMFREAIWTLPARRYVLCNLHVGTCRQCLEFSPSLRTRCCNTFRRLRCRNRRDGRTFYFQPLGLLFVKRKQRLDVPRISKGGIDPVPYMSTRRTHRSVEPLRFTYL